MILGNFSGHIANSSPRRLNAPFGRKVKEEIIYAEVDLQRILASKRILDVAGHYARPDVFAVTDNLARLPAPVPDQTR
jgi:hypothetical protein